jgi:hypothetical protein
MLAAFVAVLSGCSVVGGSSTIDGFVVGSLVACSSGVGVPTPAPSEHTCYRDAVRDEGLARAALDTRDPHHAAIVSFTRFTDGTQPTNDFTGGGTPVYRSPHPGPNVTVYVFKLADGSTVATGAACDGPDNCYGVGSYPRN